MDNYVALDDDGLYPVELWSQDTGILTDDFYENITINKTWGLIRDEKGYDSYYHDLNGEPIMVFDGWKSSVSDEGIITANRDGTYYFYDTKGVMLQELEYYKVSRIVNGFARVEKGGMCGFINADGIEVIPCVYREAEMFDENGLARVAERNDNGENEWFIINEIGDRVSSRNFDEINSFSHGLAAVKKIVGDSEAWGYIDMNGDLVIPYRYAEGNSFNEDGTVYVATTEQPGVYVKINIKGEVVSD